MRQVLNRIPLLSALLSWGRQLINLRLTVNRLHDTANALTETRQRVEDLIKHIGALHHDVNVAKHELTVMKQDLFVLRHENEDLRGLGIFVPKLEAHGEAIEDLQRQLADHRDAAHKIQERLMREIKTTRQSA